MYLRSHRLRHMRTKSALARIERRTALSLRPISTKSYVDPHSPLAFNSDSDGEKDGKEVKVFLKHTFYFDVFYSCTTQY